MGTGTRADNDNDGRGRGCTFREGEGERERCPIIHNDVERGKEEGSGRSGNDCKLQRRQGREGGRMTMEERERAPRLLHLRSLTVSFPQTTRPPKAVLLNELARFEIGHFYNTELRKSICTW